MPLDVIMPALGMAQQSGQIVAWHKRPGDPVARGDVLFEVETDKATMEVEAQGDGFLADVTAPEGADVPVGQVIARIASSAGAAPMADATPEALPEGKPVIMPTLGMAQDSGLLVKWHKGPGDAVTADDILFDVETDKSTVEVSAGAHGFVSALLAEAGDEIPVGQTIAIIGATPPAKPFARRAVPAPAAPEPAHDTPSVPVPISAPPQVQAPNGRILASPKLRRLAREQRLDLGRLVAAGHAQPFHVRDLEMLRSLPDAAAPAPAPATASATTACRLVAEIADEGFTAFATWARDHADLTDPQAILAGFCAASLGKDAAIAVQAPGTTATYAASARLGAARPTEAAPVLRLRDLRHSAIATVQVGAEDLPTLTLTRQGAGLSITLEFAQGHLGAADAITLLSNFAGRIAQPLRHLL